MVVTRRGVHVSSPSRATNTADSSISSAPQATPSTGRRTRRTANSSESPTQTTVEEASSQLEKLSQDCFVQNSARKRCTRASRLHSPDKPCTPVGSVHEEEPSDIESCCSVVSDIVAPLTRRSTRKKVEKKEEDLSEVESCSSVRRSTRKKRAPVALDSASEETDEKTRPDALGSASEEKDEKTRPDALDSASEETDEKTRADALDSASEEKDEKTRADALDSASEEKDEKTRPDALDFASEVTDEKTRADALDSASEVTDEKKQPSEGTKSASQRSRRMRASRLLAEQSDMSDAESTTGISPKSATRRSTRVRAKPSKPNECFEASQSPRPVVRRTRASRAKTEMFSDPMSCDSDGFESGPSSRETNPKIDTFQMELQSDSDITDIDRQETQSSNRTDTIGNSQVVSVLVLPKKLSVVLVPLEDDKDSLTDSRLESTVLEKGSDCTLIEEEETKPAEEACLETPTVDEGGNRFLQSITTDHELDKMTEGLAEPAVMAGEQQQETTENLLEETLEPEMMETVEPLKKVLTSSTCDDETTEDKDDVIMVNADADTLGGSEQQDGNDDVENPEGDALVSNSEKGEVQAGVDTVTELACHIEEEQEEPIQCTSSQPTAQFSEQPPQGAAVQSKRGINLLDSSDEDDDFADEIGESSGDEAEESGEELLQSTETKVTKAAEGLFMIDTRPGEDADELYYQDRLKERGQVAEEEEEEFLDEEGDDDDHDDAADVLFSSRDPQFKALSSRIDPGLRMKQLGGLYISFDGSKSKPVSNSQQKHREKKILDEVMKRSVIGPDFEKKDAVPPCNETKKALKLKRKAERAKTTGEAWFNMKAPEITPELKGDLQLLRMRGSMDSKRFYKKNDRDGFPKYFQMGTVVDNPVDFYHSRIAKKDRKRTMVEELLADAEFRQKNKRKFQTIMAEKAAQTAGRRHKKGKFQKK
ncbi:unnamed protein product [Knipowitschia caucasica]